MHRLATALFLCASAALQAQPTQLRLSVTASDPRHAMGVAWTTPDDVPTRVEHRLAGSSAAPVQTSGGAAQNVTGVGFVHTAELTGLATDTAYDYRVGDGTTWSGWKTFRTAPEACAAWSFIAVGDDRADPILNSGRGVSPKWGPIAEEAAATTPAPKLFINSGDLVYDGSDNAQWADWLASSETVTSIIPHMPVLGNHDAKGSGVEYTFNDVFFLPRNDETQSENYYAFRYANALFIAFTTASDDEGTASDPRPFARQGAWMRRVLEANQDATWKFVFLHHPSFTSGGARFIAWDLGHPPNEKEQNAVLLPLLDEFHVDFVIAGHNHWYERFEALRQGTTLEEGAPAAGPDTGTQHLITGGAGAVTLDFDIGSWNPIDLICGNTHPGQVQCTGEHHYVRFEIHGNALTMTTTATACQNDNCNHPSTPLDTLTYVKGGADACGGSTSGSSSSGPPSSSSRAGSSSNAAPASSSSAAVGGSSSATAATSAAAPPSSTASASGGVTASSGSGAVQASSGSGAAPGDETPSCGCSTGDRGTPVAAAALLLAAATLARTRRRR
ncbi:MAG: metallophosphoesterase family protein [Deltaproteobacteria bacterium]|nr:metallophosphoesterase family protein [Deltaproteobacteria bacterium]